MAYVLTLVVVAVVVVMVVTVVVMVVAVIVAVAVVLMVPVAFMHPPAFSFVVVVRMAPISVFIRGLLPASPNPLVVTALLAPISADPDVARAGRVPTPLIAVCRRTAPEIYRNLRSSGNHNSRGKYCTN
jgi:hypothetical protein